MLRRHFTAVFLIAVVVLAACGDDADDAGGDTTPTTVATTTPASSEATTTAPAAPAARPSTGCDAPAPGGFVEQEEHLDVDGADRMYLLTVPDGTDPAADPRPLVVDFHGLAEGATVHSRMSQLSVLAQEEGFVVVFPNGTGSPVGWGASTAEDPRGDRAFVTALLDTLGQQHCIDQARVYATGLSNGAMMTSAVACTMADRFAAVAPVAGVQYGDPCPAEEPMPMLTFHGTADPILLFNGGVDGAKLDDIINNGGGAGDATEPVPYDLDGPGYPAAVAGWAEHNGCDPEPTDTDVTDTVLLRTYDCPEGADVQFYVIIDGGHSWPGSEFSKSIERIVGPTTFDIDATQLMWEFFQQFSRP